MKILQIFIDSSDEDLITFYKHAALKHNEAVKTQTYSDSGFDLYTPTKMDVSDTTLYNYQIIGSMVDDYLVPYGYMLYPRSSIYKSKLRLANSVGIIDSGYRGHICAAFDVKEPTTIEKYVRYVQICSPDLKPFLVDIVTSINTLTKRGTGGFGSTGV
jgi:dUTP pyrophosphatase